MTREEAKLTEKMMEKAGRFNWRNMEVSEFGYGSGNWQVCLRMVNAKAGNRNIYIIDTMPASHEEAVLIGRTAMGEANKRDAAALARIAAERAVNAE